MVDTREVIEEALKSILTTKPRRIEGVARMQVNLMDLSTTMNLFGLPVVVTGDPYPFRGHVYNVGYMSAGGDEYLVFDVGFFEVWARVYSDREVYEYPVIVNGLPTVGTLQVVTHLRRGDHVRYYLVGQPVVDRVIARRDYVLLFDAVARNRLPVVVVDQNRAICADNLDDALERGRQYFALTTLYKYYHECKSNYDWLVVERNMHVTRSTRCESQLRELVLRFEEARTTLMELDLELRAYRTALEVYKREFSTVEDFASAVTSRTRELEERLKQAIRLFEEVTKRAQETVSPRGEEKKEKREEKPPAGEY